MPAGFNECKAKGGRIRTKLIGKDKYIHICWLGNKSFAGEVKTRKTAFLKSQRGK